MLSEAPLVEGTVAAAAAASGGASLDEVAAEARGALAMKTSQLGGADDGCAGARRRRRATGRRPGRPRGPQRDRSARAPGGAVRRDGPAVRRRRAGGQGPGWAAGEGHQPDERGGARGAVWRHAARHRLGTAGRRRAAGAGAAGGRGVRRRLGGRRRPHPLPFSLAGQPARHEKAAAIEVAPPAAGDVLTGVPASAGLAFGPAHHLHGAIAPPPDRAAEDPPPRTRDD